MRASASLDMPGKQQPPHHTEHGSEAVQWQQHREHHQICPEPRVFHHRFMQVDEHSWTLPLQTG